MNTRCTWMVARSFVLTAACAAGAHICIAQPSLVAAQGAAAAGASAPAISEDQKRIVMSTINSYRAQAHLGNMTWNDAVSKAAYKHSQYRASNPNVRESQHNETAGLPYFTAVNFWDRAALAGYSGDIYSEGMRQEVDPNIDPAQVVKALMTGPYHRQPFFTAGPVCVGAGVYQSIWTFDFGGKPAPVSTWPVNGATGVPRSGTPKDRPDPMRIHGTTVDDPGYVVTVQFAAGGFKYKEATMADASGAPVKLYVNHPQNDPFCGYCVIMIPAAKLAAHTVYKCHLAGTMPDGKPLAKDWSFTTGDDNDNFDVPKA